MENKNYYDVLGISKNASDNDIKSAYRKLVKQYHPDVCKEKDAEQKFKEVQEAYDILSDKDKRAQYDRFGRVDNNPGENPFTSGFNPFADAFGFGFGRSREMKEQGANIKINLTLNLKEIFEGVHKKLKIKKQCTCHRCHGSGSATNETTRCPDCNGTGYKTIVQHTPFGIQQMTSPCDKCHGTGKIIKDPCPMCNGTGLVEELQEVEFDVPAGMPNNSYFVVDGKGHNGPHNGTPGDLIVVISELPNSKGIGRDDTNNLTYTAHVKLSDLIFGADIEVPWIDGYKKIHIDEGTQPGKIKTMFGLGMPNPNNPSYKSDYKITIEAIIPKYSELYGEDKEAVDKLRKNNKF